MKTNRKIITAITILTLIFVSGYSQEFKKVESKHNEFKQKEKVVKSKKAPLLRGQQVPKKLFPEFKRKKRKTEQKKVPEKKEPYKKYNHIPYKKIKHDHKHFKYPRFYHHHIHPKYLYRGLWIRWYCGFPNGYIFWNDYPYFVYHGYLHRYSDEDPGSFDLVDSFTDETYATFYGNTIKESYDRAAELREILNYKCGEYRYFVAERFEYDPNHDYDWNPDDYPDWLWY